MRVILCSVFLVACAADEPKTDGAADAPASPGSDSGDPDGGGDGGDDGAGTEGDGTGSDGDTADDTGGGGSGGDEGGGSGSSDDGGGDGADAWPLDGMGTLTGDCGDRLDPTLLADATPLLFQIELDLGTDGFDAEALSPGGTEVWTDGNLGGSSVESEVVAYEVLYRCEGATLVKTEGEIVYDDPSGKKTDLLVEIDGVRLGVSVTRAVGWPQDDPYTVGQATDLLTDKLGDIPVSSGNVAEEDAWSRQILSVVAFGAEHAVSIETAWSELDAEVRGDTLLVVTATHGDDAELY